jgi:hypothetical protein
MLWPARLSVQGVNSYGTFNYVRTLLTEIFEYIYIYIYARCYKKSFTMVFQVTVWRVLRKRLHIKINKLFFVQHKSIKHTWMQLQTSEDGLKTETCSTLTKNKMLPVIRYLEKPDYT